MTRTFVLTKVYKLAYLSISLCGDKGRDSIDAKARRPIEIQSHRADSKVWTTRTNDHQGSLDECRD